MRYRLLVLITSLFFISCAEGDIEAADIIACGTFDSKTHFCDRRDGSIYRYVKMPDGKYWMAENLNYKPPSLSRCYEDNSENCDIYGRLYSWTERAVLCPSGWRIPEMANDWEFLEREVGNGIFDERLKAKEGWNGTDDYDFTALPAGLCRPDNNYNCSEFAGLNEMAVFMNSSDGAVWLIADDQDMKQAHPRALMSVRCVRP